MRAYKIDLATQSFVHKSFRDSEARSQTVISLSEIHSNSINKRKHSGGKKQLTDLDSYFKEAQQLLKQLKKQKNSDNTGDCYIGVPEPYRDLIWFITPGEAEIVLQGGELLNKSPFFIKKYAQQGPSETSPIRTKLQINRQSSHIEEAYRSLSQIKNEYIQFKPIKALLKAYRTEVHAFEGELACLDTSMGTKGLNSIVPTLEYSLKVFKLHRKKLALRQSCTERTDFFIEKIRDSLISLKTGDPNTYKMFSENLSEVFYHYSKKCMDNQRGEIFITKPVFLEFCKHFSLIEDSKSGQCGISKSFLSRIISEYSEHQRKIYKRSFLNILDEIASELYGEYDHDEKEFSTQLVFLYEFLECDEGRGYLRIMLRPTRVNFAPQGRVQISAKKKPFYKNHSDYAISAQVRKDSNKQEMKEVYLSPTTFKSHHRSSIRQMVDAQYHKHREKIMKPKELST